MSSFDVAVVGLGGAGSSAAYHLASGGSTVLGLEQFGPVHAHGSSHGRSRIYRTAYHEGPAYVPLVQRAQALWFDLERNSGEAIIRRTGGLMIGRPDSPVVRGARRSAEIHSLAHEMLPRREVERRFPAFSLDAEEGALWDPDAGVLFPEACIRAHTSLAIDRRAELHYGERVTRWSSTGNAVTVRTRSGEYRARSLVLTAGGWTRQMATGLDLPLDIERQFMMWFAARDREITSPDRMPVFIWDGGERAQTYGVPDLGDGVKVGSWHGKHSASPETADRTFREADAVPVRRFVKRSLRGVEPRERTYTSCLYTNAPDHHFLIGRHPRHRNVVIVSACSGHGFKFTSVLGEVVPRLVSEEETGFDLSMFDPGRFTRSRR